jgi:uncharacterized protein (TIGR03083 family)
MRTARQDVRSLLLELTPEQWHQQSLCQGWTVRDLAAHLVAWDNLLLYRTRRQHLRAFVRFMVRYGRALGSLDRLNERLRAETASLTPEEIRLRFGTDDEPDLCWLFDGSNASGHLAEHVVHEQDIRRPLGLPRPVRPDVLVAALDGLTQLPSVRWDAWRAQRRRRWEATDVAWAGGRGETVRAPGETILMTLAGRPGFPIDARS